MGYRVDNAIIMAAGYSSRFAPISHEKPKALIEVKGEILIERQICQLKQAGIPEIILVVGYQKEQFSYLKEKYGVVLVENTEYKERNNHSSVYAAREYLKNSYLCSADNYFSVNPFEKEVEESYYAAVYAEGKTNEWCLETNRDGWITDVTIGGSGKWYMLGHTFWSEKFSKDFIKILTEIYDLETTKAKLWEAVYKEHLSKLPMKIRKYPSNRIYEFDTLDELRTFDSKYLNHSGSKILEYLARKADCAESEITACKPVQDKAGNVTGFTYRCRGNIYCYDYKDGRP